MQIQDEKIFFDNREKYPDDIYHLNPYKVDSLACMI